MGRDVEQPRPFLMLLFTGVRGRLQPVEKVGTQLIATKKRAPKAPKPAYLVPNLG